MALMADNDGIWRPNAPFDKDKIQWPLSYSLRPPEEGAQPRKWWHQSYYRGPQGQSVRIYYSSSRPHSEVIAQGFLNEPVLGFDMEWPWDANKRTRLQEKVALIQIACERKIALFHIALHDGQTSEELIAPSLRQIIESANIIKTGVAILSADFRRLKDYFQLQPRGAFELSHLHNLVTYGLQNPENVTTRLRALSLLVELHLGLPLQKGTVRTSNWSLPLDEEQKTYAADDAYAGYMLFHRMNALRLQMSPMPPLPKLSESYLPFQLPAIIPVQLESKAEGAGAVPLTAKGFFTPKLAEDEATNDNRNREEARRFLREARDLAKEEGENKQSSLANVSQMPEISSKIYEQLVSHRREFIATNVSGWPPYMVATNAVLENLARERPTNEAQLLQIEGVGKGKVAAHGKIWLQIINNYIAEQESDSFLPPTSNAPIIPPPEEDTQLLQPEAGRHPSKRVKYVGRSKEIILPPPMASTGLSFEFADTRIDDDELPTRMDDGSSWAPGKLSPRAAYLKRKRDEGSEAHEETHTSLVPSLDPIPPRSLDSGPTISNEVAQPEPLSKEQQLLRRKLDACVKSVVSAMKPKPEQSIVSEDTLHCLVTTLPRTLDEFNQVPGIQMFIQSCTDVGKDLWATFSKWTQAPGLM
ncbi:hypothetical protein F4804DRAFT_341681 [Jackrogersella minutella]|nr:hypothetical protein F4804DRAFT_341681 [Jackrogersella minutella]